MHLGSHVEGGDAATNALLLWGDGLADGAGEDGFGGWGHLFGNHGLLVDVHLEGDVELLADLEEFVQIFAWVDFVDGGTVAGAEELVVEVLADDRVFAAAGAEDIHAADDFAVGEECGA